MADNPHNSSAEAEQTFEQALASLEKISQEMESGQLGLSQSLEKYEEGVMHLRHCYSLLQKAEKKIQLLTGIDKDGNAVTREFEHSASFEESVALEESKNASEEAKRTSKSAKSPKKPKSDVKSQSKHIDDSNSLF